ncbi:hypothetical protein [uncultured Anaerovibrio sp.]|uniref:hypothetical protein n=1 Tax=uncultured Anaerovibrio sp. TaxID=361586 RepID=UPI002605A7E9|nr:hypothetical protein [uncultured Anaerovibrio sp.]
MLEKLKKVLSKEKKCVRCGSEEKVEKIYVSNITGHGHFEYLCATCALKEKLKCY